MAVLPHELSGWYPYRGHADNVFHQSVPQTEAILSAMDLRRLMHLQAPDLFVSPNGFYNVQEQIVHLGHPESGSLDIGDSRPVHIRTEPARDLCHQRHHQLERIVAATRVFKHKHFTVGFQDPFECF